MKTLILTGGGSAGHVTPNLALLPALRARFSLAYIGTDGIERELLRGAKIPYYTIACPKFVRGSLLKNAALPFRLHAAVRQAKHALQQAHADGVFCAGGYVSLPVAYAAKGLGLPVCTHESDSTAGLANRLIARFAASVTTSFPSAAQSLRGGVCCGAPLREELFCGSRTAARKAYGFADTLPVLLVFGGGSGSAAIGAALQGALPVLLRSFQILHLYGKGAPPAARSGYVPLAYEKNMAQAYAAADYVLARAGANTLFEVAALKKPALVIPLENRRTRGDQAKNAALFAQKKWVRVLPERALSAAALPAALAALAGDTALTAALAAAPPLCGNRKILQRIGAAFAAEP